MSGIRRERRQGTNSGKPVRGTAIVLRRGALLLVQERANVHYSFPGGAHNTGETWMCTAVRELKEELSLNVRTAERLAGFDFESEHRAHKLSLLTTDQEPVIASREIRDFIWWTPDSTVLVAPSVPAIWNKLRAAGLISSDT